MAVSAREWRATDFRSSIARVLVPAAAWLRDDRLVDVHNNAGDHLCEIAAIP